MNQVFRKRHRRFETCVWCGAREVSSYVLVPDELTKTYRYLCRVCIGRLPSSFDTEMPEEIP